MECHATTATCLPARPTQTVITVNTTFDTLDTCSRPRRCLRCKFPGCEKEFPSKYFLKRHARCHSKIRTSSPTIALNTHSRKTSAQIDNIGAKIPDDAEKLVFASATNETKREERTNLSETQNRDPIPVELQQLGIDTDWLLNPTPLETTAAPCGHGTPRLNPSDLKIGHVMLLLQMKERFDFTIARVTKWLTVLGVDPTQALAAVLNNHSSLLGEDERKHFWLRPLIGSWDDSLVAPSSTKQPNTLPRPTSQSSPSFSSSLPVPIVPSSSSSITCTVSPTSSSAFSTTSSKVSFDTNASSKLLDPPLQSRVVSSFTTTAIVSSSSSSSSIAISSSSSLSAIGSSVSSSSSSSTTVSAIFRNPSSSSVSEEPIEDIPLPTERICQTDPELLSQIALPKPISLHDIPLPELSTIPLPIEKQTKG